MSGAVREQKIRWRRAAKALFGLMPPDSSARRELDRALVRNLTEYAAARGTRRLLGFAPLADEPGIADFFRRWPGPDRSLAMPVWPGGPDMFLRRVDDWDRDLRRAQSGIDEPGPALPEVSPEDVDLAVIPGRCFSEECRRLGRGAGCYDSLVRGRTMHRVGVAYDFQVFPDIPASDGDESMDAVITPSRILINRDASRRLSRSERNNSCPTSATP